MTDKSKFIIKVILLAISVVFIAVSTYFGNTYPESAWTMFFRIATVIFAACALLSSWIWK